MARERESLNERKDQLSCHAPASISSPAIGASVSKVTEYSRALQMITSSNGNLTGFVARTADLDGATSAGQLIDRLRLDHPRSGLADTQPFAVMETQVNAGMAASMKVPKDPGFATGSADEFIPDAADRVYPFTGNGLTASRDGRIVPELSTAPVLMSSDVTVIAFKNANGTPLTVTLGAGGSSDRWVLRHIDPSDPSAGVVWEALP